MDPLPKLTESEEAADTWRPAFRCVELTPSSAPQPFWARFGRAVAILLIASSAHLWLVRVPRTANQQVAVRPATPSVSSGKPASTVPSADVDVLTDLVVAGTSGRVTPSPAQNDTILRREEPRVRLASTAVPVRQVNPQAAPPPESSAPRYATRPASALAESVTNAPQGIPLSLIRRPPAPTKDAGTRPGAARVDQPPVAVDQQQLVRRLLQDYVSAFERLDAHAAKAVWPTVDDKALRHAFDQLEAQRLTFDSCGITIEGAGANARCQGEATYRARIGSRAPRSSSREWIFNLAKAETGWRIVDATVR